MKTSTTNLTLIATLAFLTTASSVFAIGPGRLSMNNLGGSKRLPISGGRSSYGSSKQFGMKSERVSVQGNGKHIEIGNGRISMHGGGKHVEINNGSYDTSYGSHCHSNVVYSTPQVSYEPQPQHEVTYSPPTTWVNHQVETPAYDPTEYVNSGLEPVNSSYIIEPGDSLYEVSLKMYRTSDAAESISTYNRIPLDASLRPGTVVYLPSISPDGELSRSAAPPALVR